MSGDRRVAGLPVEPFAQTQRQAATRPPTDVNWGHIAIVPAKGLLETVLDFRWTGEPDTWALTLESTAPGDLFDVTYGSGGGTRVSRAVPVGTYILHGQNVQVAVQGVGVGGGSTVNVFLSHGYGPPNLP